MKNYLEEIKVGLLAVIAICGIILVIKGFSDKTQDVYVNGGRVNADVSGSIYVGNTVDVNVDGVMGYQIGSHKSYTIDGKDYHAIDVYNCGH